MNAPRRSALRLDHVGIAVRDLEKARREYERILGCEPSPVEVVESEKVRLSFFELANCRIELLEPTDEESPIHRFLERGRTGVHHLSLSVEDRDIEEVHAELDARGVPTVGGIRAGSEGSRVFFLHPSAASGVLLELASPGGGQESGAT